MTLKIVRNSAADKSISTWMDDPAFATINSHPIYGGFGRNYYPATAGDSHRDVSFAVVSGDTPAVIAPASIGDGRISYYGLPLRLFERQDITPSLAQDAVKAALDEIDTLLSGGNATAVNIHDDSATGRLSAVGEACLNRHYRPSVKLTARCDLSGGEEGMRKTLRKSFRSLINWGKRSMTLSFVNQQNPDPALLRNFQDFHARIAGRVTRPQASWDAMYSWIVAGRGELTLGHLETGELVAGNVIVDGDFASYYASGVYDRERFEKPMAHWPLWNAMCRAAERGITRFDLGDIPLDDIESKEYAIGYFKRGFASEIASSFEWSHARQRA